MKDSELFQEVMAKYSLRDTVRRAKRTTNPSYLAGAETDLQTLRDVITQTQRELMDLTLYLEKLLWVLHDRISGDLTPQPQQGKEEESS